MPEFKSIKALEEHLRKQINDVLENEVAKIVKQTELSAIYDVVYGAYGNIETGEPNAYVRRYDSGGLASVQNMESKAADGVLRVKNTTPFHDEYGFYNHGTGLDKLVEYGNGGGGFGYEFPLGKDTFGSFLIPRPFTEETIDRLDVSEDHIEGIRNGLRRRGIHVK